MKKMILRAILPFHTALCCFSLKAMETTRTESSRSVSIEALVDASDGEKSYSPHELSIALTLQDLPLFLNNQGSSKRTSVDLEKVTSKTDTSKKHKTAEKEIAASLVDMASPAHAIRVPPANRQISLSKPISSIVPDQSTINAFIKALYLLENDTQAISLIHAWIQKRYSINVRNENGATALMVASHKGHSATVHFLCDRNADVNIIQKKGWTALMYAADKGNLSIVTLLIQKNAIVNLGSASGVTPLMLAAQNGHYDVAQALCLAGAIVNVGDIHGMTALMFAAQHGHKRMVELLYDSSANITLQNKQGFTAIHHAQLFHMGTVVTYLEEKYKVLALPLPSLPRISRIPKYYIVKPSKLVSMPAQEITTAAPVQQAPSPAVYPARTRINMLISDILTLKNDLKVIEKIQHWVADGLGVNEKGFANFTLLIAASMSGNLLACQFLCYHGAIIDAQNDHGTSPLIAAARHGHLAIVDFLCTKNADITLKHSSEGTARDVALRHEKLDIVSYLDEYVKNQAGSQPESPLAKVISLATSRALETEDTLLLEQFTLKTKNALQELITKVAITQNNELVGKLQSLLGNAKA